MSAQRTPDEVFQHHGEVLGAGDIEGIVSDYSDDAIFISPDGILRGKDGVRQAFVKLEAGTQKGSQAYKNLHDAMMQLLSPSWKALMMERLHGWKETHPMVGDVRGRGLMIGVELVKDKATREPASAVRNRVETLAFERGLLVLGCGETSIRLCPPLILKEHEATVALDILEDALSVAEKEAARA